MKNKYVYSASYIKICKDFQNFPKVFKNCADIYITKGKLKGQGYGI